MIQCDPRWSHMISYDLIWSITLIMIYDLILRQDPMVWPQGWNGVQILFFDMLKNLRRASVLVFTRRRTLNPKTLNPKTLKTLNPKPEHTVYHCVFSAISHVQQQGILNGAIRANHGGCAWRRAMILCQGGLQKGVPQLDTPAGYSWMVNDG